MKDRPAPDLCYVVDLAKKNYEAIGFIPEPRLRWYAERGQVLMAEENGEPAGFLVFGNGWPILKVYQACVQYDARRRDHGLALVARLVDRAKRRGLQGIALWCADDLDSNEFWRAAGFSFAGQRDVGNIRGRLHNRWVLLFTDQPTLGLEVA